MANDGWEDLGSSWEDTTESETPKISNTLSKNNGVRPVDILKRIASAYYLNPNLPSKGMPSMDPFSSIGRAFQEGGQVVSDITKPNIPLVGSIPVVGDILTNPTTYIGGGSIGKTALRYPYEKVLGIRGGLRSAQRAASNEFGKTIKNVGGEINPLDTFSVLERELINRGILDQSGKAVGKPIDKVSSALKKNYDYLMSKFEGDTIPAQEIIKVARRLKASAGKPSASNTFYRDARNLHDTVIDSIKDKINDKAFQLAKDKYSLFKEQFNPLEQLFKPYASKMEKTGAGERAIMDKFSLPIGTQDALKNLPELTGQTTAGGTAASYAKLPMALLRTIFARRGY